MFSHKVFLTLAAVLTLGSGVVPPAAAAACDEPVHRAFDFWLGEWEARTNAGRLFGNVRVQRAYDGCVLRESYTSDRGYSGESLTIYDAARKIWHQTVVGNDGTLLVLEGSLRDGKMVMTGQTANLDAQPTKHRITWSPNADGSVSQSWETTNAKGQWETTKGVFSRK